MHGTDGPVVWQFLVVEAHLLLTFVILVLPIAVGTWLVSTLNPFPKSLGSELGREGETRSWDRERRRRFGRHQHRHGHHHRDR
ncbi:MAG TPA: hypothetical protein VJA21_18910 [Verrucomicrobiae bacterium]